MKNKLVSVIVPVYNVEQYLAECLASIKRFLISKIGTTIGELGEYIAFGYMILLIMVLSIL